MISPVGGHDCRVRCDKCPSIGPVGFSASDARRRAKAGGWGRGVGGTDLCSRCGLAELDARIARLRELGGHWRRL